MIRKGIVGRLLKTIREFYPVIMPVTVVCIVFSAVVSAVPTIFMQKIIAVIEDNWESGGWDTISREIVLLVTVLAGFYVLSLLAGIIYNQLMAIITQGSLKKLRSRMFNGMQLLPIKYFDRYLLYHDLFLLMADPGRASWRFHNASGYEKGRRRLGKVFLSPANGIGKGRGLRRGDDERAEGS